MQAQRHGYTSRKNSSNTIGLRQTNDSRVVNQSDLVSSSAR